LQHRFGEAAGANTDYGMAQSVQDIIHTMLTSLLRQAGRTVLRTPSWSRTVWAVKLAPAIRLRGAHLELAAVDALSSSTISPGEVTSLDHEAGLYTTHLRVSTLHLWCLNTSEACSLKAWRKDAR
jgi:hypothetical protein